MTLTDPQERAIRALISTFHTISVDLREESLTGTPVAEPAAFMADRLEQWAAILDRRLREGRAWEDQVAPVSLLAGALTAVFLNSHLYFTNELDPPKVPVVLMPPTPGQAEG